MKFRFGALIASAAAATTLAACGTSLGPPPPGSISAALFGVSSDRPLVQNCSSPNTDPVRRALEYFVAGGSLTGPPVPGYEPLGLASDGRLLSAMDLNNGIGTLTGRVDFIGPNQAVVGAGNLNATLGLLTGDGPGGPGTLDALVQGTVVGSIGSARQFTGNVLGIYEFPVTGSLSLTSPLASPPAQLGLLLGPGVLSATGGYAVHAAFASQMPNAVKAFDAAASGVTTTPTQPDIFNNAAPTPNCSGGNRF